MPRSPDPTGCLVAVDVALAEGACHSGQATTAGGDGHRGTEDPQKATLADAGVQG